MSHRRVVVLASLAVGVVVLAACSSGSSFRSASPASPATSAPTSDGTASSPVTSSTDRSTESSATEPATTATATTGRSSSTTTDAPSTSTTPPPATPPTNIGELLNLGRPIVLAHTGGEDEFPGSTMFAFGQSVKAGVDMLDLNVLLTADGVLVVQHDDSVDRLTNATGKVGAMTYAELAKLDNAYWFTPDGVGTDHPDDAYIYRGIRTGSKPPPPGYAPDDFAIPRLTDVITRYPNMPLNIEIESSGESAAAAARVLATELRDLHREDAAVVTSFDDATVTLFHQLAPAVEITPGLNASAAWVLDGTPLPDGMTILQLPPRFSGIDVITPASVGKAHAAGYQIWVWPNDRALENPASYDSFLAEGVDGLNINFPATGVVAVQRFLARTE